ncbi:Uncharacterised protein [Nocardia africana]|uniref:Uncharacterized protein n=2 Tax=Nocardia africana TaxID=134964 RepID=A0A378WYF2_9NOCA|nr:Uncharacterised protein [Nocardia africana]
MRLVVPPRETHVALIGVGNVGVALSLIAELRRAGLTLEAAELMTRAGIHLVCKHCALRAPLAADPAFYLLEEV